MVVLGGGSTGEAFAGALRALEPETPITLIEQGLVGGECSYYACMPSKALLRPAEALAAARLVPGAAEAVTGALDVERAFWHRDQVTGGLDDSSQVDWLAEHDIELVRGHAHVSAPGAIEVGERTVGYGRLLIATGSVPSIPPIPGLDAVEFWTNREATSTHEVPGRLVVVGAGPVGCELAQAFARMGSRVTVVDAGDRLLARDHPAAGALLADVLTGEGVTVRLGQKVERVEPEVRAWLSDGTSVEADRILIAVGRRANVAGLGFEALGLTISDRGIEVDEQRRPPRCVGRGRRHRDRDVHPRRQVPGPARRGRDGRARGASRLPGAVPAVVHRIRRWASVGDTSGEGTVMGERGSTARLSTYGGPAPAGFLKVVRRPAAAGAGGAVAVGGPERRASGSAS